jgi:hypothetical protein
LTWKIGIASIARCRSRRRAARVRRRRREADLVVDDDVDRAARAVAVELREVEHLRDEPLPANARVAVHEHRDDARALLVAEAILRARTRPSTTGSTASRCDGLNASERQSSFAVLSLGQCSRSRGGTSRRPSPRTSRAVDPRTRRRAARSTSA